MMGVVIQSHSCIAQRGNVDGERREVDKSL